MEEAAKVGIVLDDSGNAEKQQIPSETVTALGVYFDTRSWTWGFKEGKLPRILHTLNKVKESEVMDRKELESITGKLGDVKFLVPGGKFNMLYFLQAVHMVEDGRRQVVISPKLREQADWWMVALRAADTYSPILHPDSQRPSSAKESWSDAAGGTSSHMGAGLGGDSDHWGLELSSLASLAEQWKDQ